jgi:hypothetical protein
LAGRVREGRRPSRCNSGRRGSAYPGTFSRISSGTGSGALPLSLNSTVVNSSSVSPMFSTLWTKNSPGGKRKCFVSPG